MSDNFGTKRVAVCTGSYRGIGLEIVKGLCQKFDGIVYMTARNVEAGQKAVEELRKTGLSVQFHQLDIENIESIINLAAHIKQTHGGLDVLVNNAAISLGGKNLPIEQDAEQTIRANFTGTLNVCKVLFPLLRSNARVVHISSRAGFLRLIKNKRLREQFSDKSATVEDIERLVRNYLMSCKNGTWKKDGYPRMSYAVSKIALNAITPIQQRSFDVDKKRQGIIVSGVCPGYCKTDMTSHKGFTTAEQGAETPLYLALLPVEFKGRTGAFWAENQTINWTGNIFIQALKGIPPTLKKTLFKSKPKSS